MSGKMDDEWKKIEKKVLSYQVAVRNNDDDVMKKKFDIFLGVKKLVKVEKEYKNDALMDLIVPEIKGEIDESKKDFLMNFDPAKCPVDCECPFEHYFSTSFRFKKKDAYYQNNGYRDVREKNEDTNKNEHKRKHNVSLNISVGEDESTTLEDLFQSNYSEGSPEHSIEKIRAIDLALRTITTMCNFRLTGRKNNDSKKKYMRLFFTDTATFMIKDPYCPEAVDPFREREQDIIKAINLSFLDFFMVDQNRTIDEIESGALKNEHDIRATKGYKELTPPLGNYVFYEYINQKTEDSVSDKVISTQRKDYNKILKENLGLFG